MSSEMPNPNRREFLKKSAAVAVGMAMPEIAQSAEKQKTTAEVIADLRERAQDIQKRIQEFKELNMPALQKDLGPKVFPELKRRAQEAKDIAMAEGADVALMEADPQKDIREIGTLYETFDEIEKDIDRLAGGTK